MNYSGRFLVASSLLLSAAGCQPITKKTSLPDGIVLLKEKTAELGSPSISYQKYQLKNGLTVILHQDKSDPLVHVDMTYHVGSAREVVGKSGFAHFFEHMMFQGSKHVGDQQHLKLVTESGGDANGSTNRDLTNYYQTVPANQLEKVLWLEADRMGFLLDAVSEQKFEIQRDTVKNERAQNVDNRPYGLIAETLAAAMYPSGHPYSWPTIGHMQDIDSAKLTDLKEFFLRWYGPNNATLTIGGDINVLQTLTWVNKYFGEIPSAPKVEKAKIAKVSLKEDRFITLEDKIIQPLLVIEWPTEYPLAPANMPLEMLAAVLSQGKNSVLYQSLVKTDKALSVDASQDCGELACTFQLSVLGHQGQSLQALYQLVQQELAALAVKGVSKEKLDEVKNLAESEAIFSIESVHGKVAQLAANQTYYAEPDRLQLRLNESNAVTPQQVNEVLNNFLLTKPKVVLSVVPTKKANLEVQPPNFEITKAKPAEFKKSNQQSLVRTTPLTFDRSLIPMAQQAVNVRVPSLYRTKLKNGIEVVGTFMNETATVSLHLILPAGKLMAPANQIGLASLTAQLMNEGTVKHSSEQLESQLNSLGSMVGLYSNTNNTILSLSSLSKNLTKTLAIAEEILFEPRFNQSDFERIKKQMLARLEMYEQSAKWLAAQATREVLYKDAWHRLPSSGTVKTISNITLDDVKAFYQQNYTPDQAKIVLVGDIQAKQVAPVLAKLALWKGDKARVPAKMEPTKLNKSAIWLVDKPNAPQSIVQFVRHGVPFDITGEMYKLQLANFSFAGNFNSRLNLNLRENKGYTYGVSGSIMGVKDYGSISFSASVRADATIATIQEIQRELTTMAYDGLSDEELAFMRLAIGEKKALEYETPSDKANLIADMIRYQLPEDYGQQRQQLLANITKIELNALAKKWFQPQNFQIIVVGDTTKLKPALEKLGLPINVLSL